MVHSTRGIVLHYIKYSETSVITSVYTEDFGKLSYIINGIRKAGKKKKNHLALLQPFTLLNMQIYFKAGKQLQRIREFSLDVPLYHIPYEMNKRNMALFMAEVLKRSLREEESDTALFSFLHNFIQMFDLDEGSANLHLLFLIQLSKYLGFYPRIDSWPDSQFFDLRRGYFLPHKPEHTDYLTADEGRLLASLAKTDYTRYGQLNFSNQQRSRLLDILLYYYKLHTEGMGEIKSLEVIRALYH